MASATQHGVAQPGDKVGIRNFCGMEGLLIATLLEKQIRLYLGAHDSEEFLPISKGELLSKLQVELEGQTSLLYKEQSKTTMLLHLPQPMRQRSAIRQISYRS